MDDDNSLEDALGGQNPSAAQGQMAHAASGHVNVECPLRFPSQSENVECSGMHSRLFVMLLLLLSANAARAQVKVQVQECGLKSLQVCALHVAQDEVGLITAPFHLSAPSYYWLLPLWSGHRHRPRQGQRSHASGGIQYLTPE